ncbi:hypothetical protein CL614_08350 [archaeon]|nr:hypothetical protein [archaeon]
MYGEKAQLIELLREHFSVNTMPMISARIERMYNCKGVDVRQAVHSLRMEGMPICSGTKGYWLAQTSAEVQNTIEHLEERECGIRVVRKALEKSQTRWFSHEQPTLF